jgi:hypothetical protein
MLRWGTAKAVPDDDVIDVGCGQVKWIRGMGGWKGIGARSDSGWHCLIRGHLYGASVCDVAGSIIGLDGSFVGWTANLLASDWYHDL